MKIHSKQLVVVVALLSTLAVAGAFVLAALPHFRTHLRLRELRRKPDLLEAWLTDPSLDSHAVKARDQFLQEDAGRQTLFELYLDEYDRRKFDNLTIRRRLEHMNGQRSDEGVMALRQDGYCMSLRNGIRTTSTGSTINIPQDPQRRRAILARLSLCDDRIFRVPSFPDFEFEVQSVVNRQALEASWRRQATSNMTLRRVPNPKTTFVCYFRLLSNSPRRPSRSSQGRTPVGPWISPEP